MAVKNTKYMVAIVEDTQKEADLLKEHFSKYSEEQQASFQIA